MLQSQQQLKQHNAVVQCEWESELKLNGMARTLNFRSRFAVE